MDIHGSGSLLPNHWIDVKMTSQKIWGLFTEMMRHVEIDVNYSLNMRSVRYLQDFTNMWRFFGTSQKWLDVIHENVEST